MADDCRGCHPQASNAGINGLQASNHAVLNARIGIDNSHNKHLHFEYKPFICFIFDKYPPEVALHFAHRHSTLFPNLSPSAPGTSFSLSLI